MNPPKSDLVNDEISSKYELKNNYNEGVSDLFTQKPLYQAESKNNNMEIVKLGQPVIYDINLQMELDFNSTRENYKCNNIDVKNSISKS